MNREQAEARVKAANPSRGPDDYPPHCLELREGQTKGIETAADIVEIATALARPWGLGLEAVDFELRTGHTGWENAFGLIELTVATTPKDYDRLDAAEEE